MSFVRSLAGPCTELAAYARTIAQVWGAPGINNPDDDEPINNPVPNPLLDTSVLPDFEPVLLPPSAVTPPSEPAVSGAAARDTRTRPQRYHDAFKAVMRNALVSKQLGQHSGLPVTVVISTTLAELQAAAGLATTSAGTVMPIPDLIRLAEHACHYLLVYRRHTAEPLYLARTKRLASKAQRLVMISRDRGCTMPGCPVDGGDCQVYACREGLGRRRSDRYHRSGAWLRIGQPAGLRNGLDQPYRGRWPRPLASTATAGYRAGHAQLLPPPRGTAETAR
ncbi:MAG: DUF222 domain-containing protein [Mycobacterium sp.]